MSFLLSKDRKIKLAIFYKSRKLSNFFIKNKVHSRSEDINDRHYVVYQYTCNRVGCESTQTYTYWLGLHYVHDQRSIQNAQSKL